MLLSFCSYQVWLLKIPVEFWGTWSVVYGTQSFYCGHFSSHQRGILFVWHLKGKRRKGLSQSFISYKQVGKKPVAVAKWFARLAAKQEVSHFSLAFYLCWNAHVRKVIGKVVAPEVNFRECISCMPPLSANKAAHSGFETQRRHHQKSKTRVSVAQKCTCVHQQK